MGIDYWLYLLHLCNPRVHNTTRAWTVQYTTPCNIQHSIWRILIAHSICKVTLYMSSQFHKFYNNSKYLQYYCKYKIKEALSFEPISDTWRIIVKHLNTFLSPLCLFVLCVCLSTCPLFIYVLHTYRS